MAELLGSQGPVSPKPYLVNRVEGGSLLHCQPPGQAQLAEDLTGSSQPLFTGETHSELSGDLIPTGNQPVWSRRQAGVWRTLKILKPGEKTQSGVWESTHGSPGDEEKAVIGRWIPEESSSEADMSQESRLQPCQREDVACTVLKCKPQVAGELGHQDWPQEKVLASLLASG